MLIKEEWLTKSLLFYVAKTHVNSGLWRMLTNVTKIKHVEIEQYQKTLYIQERLTN